MEASELKTINNCRTFTRKPCQSENSCQIQVGQELPTVELPVLLLLCEPFFSKFNLELPNFKIEIDSITVNAF